MRGDERIKKDVVDHLFWDDRVDASGIDVSVSKGRVVLSGKVSSPFSRAVALSDARVAGVWHVEDRLEMQPSEVHSDETLRADVEAALARAPRIDASRVRVEVKDGVAILAGSVDAFWKKEHVRTLLFHAVPIRDVEDQLAVVSSSTFRDESIADAVEAALERSPAITPSDVQIEVNDGRVSISGRVSSWEAKQAAFQAAAQTPGVTDVRDGLEVAASE